MCHQRSNIQAAPCRRAPHQLCRLSGRDLDPPRDTMRHFRHNQSVRRVRSLGGRGKLVKLLKLASTRRRSYFTTYGRPAPPGQDVQETVRVRGRDYGAGDRQECAPCDGSGNASLPSWAQVNLYGGILVNAALLLVSSAWMAGQTPDVIIPVNHATSCGTNCGSSCCDSGPRWRDRLRGLFHRDRCQDDCAQPCPQPRCQPCPQPRCQPCPQPRCQPACPQPRCHVVCQPQCRPQPACGHRCRSSCDDHGRAHSSCGDDCGRGRLFERIRNAFHRDRGCCGDCGPACVSEHTPGHAPAEPLREQPKKMPSKDVKKATTQGQIVNPPAQTAVPALQSAPTIAPTLAPRIIENDGRNNPF